MQILIGCAKTMAISMESGISDCTEPAFQGIANELATQLAGYSPEELQSLLNVNRQIAKENWQRYQHFPDKSKRIPAIFAYDGMVFQKIAAETMSREDLQYANSHLFIGSFLYGLLRPLDLINRYRLEGKVELPYTDFRTLFDFWKPVLTDRFIDSVKSDDGILVNLASNEFKDIFDWKRVKNELTVITPEFRVEKDGKMKTVVIYAKMCRGAMTRWIVRNRITNPEHLKAFEYDGFRYDSGWKFTIHQTL